MIWADVFQCIIMIGGMIAILIKVSTLIEDEASAEYVDIMIVSAMVRGGCRRSRVVTFTAIRLRGPGFNPNLLQAHPSGGEGVSPVQGEAN